MWDGNHDTAINYFWKIQQLAAMKSYLPQALGYWLWMNLKEESTVHMWFATLNASHNNLNQIIVKRL